MLVEKEQFTHMDVIKLQRELNDAAARRALRNQFAAAYLTGIVGSVKPTDNEHKVTKDAFRFAQAMLTESERV